MLAYDTIVLPSLLVKCCTTSCFELAQAQNIKLIR